MELGVAIITYNESVNIKRCLESVKWANEIVIVDSGSQDNTLGICREYTNRVYSHDWAGYSRQKQKAIDLLQSEWVLSLDADEELSPSLQLEIKKTLKNPQFFAYEFPRQLVFGGQILKYAEGGSKRFRLFRRGSAKMNGKRVHEGLVTKEKVGTLLEPLYHHSFQSLDDRINKMNIYSSLSASEKAEEGKKGSLLKGILHGFWAFVKIYFLQRAFLDGALGFVFSFALAEDSYYRYVKLAFDHKTVVHSSCRRKTSGKSSHQPDSQ